MYTSLEWAMARNGYRIFDSDTHVGPYMDVLERYLAAEEKAKLAGWEPFKSKSKGHTVYTKGQRRYLRKLGTAQADADKGGYMAGFTGAKRLREPDDEAHGFGRVRLCERELRNKGEEHCERANHARCIPH